MSRLLKTSSVLTFAGIADDLAGFTREDEGRGIGLAIDLDLYEDLGSPDEVTVRIKPGAKL